MCRKTSLRRRLEIDYLEDRTMMTVTPITVANPSFSGISGFGPSSNPSMSADGQLVVFESAAPNLVSNDVNGEQSYESQSVDVFLYNRATGVVSLISRALDGNAAGQCDYDGYTPSIISPDGRYVAFQYSGSNLVQGVSGFEIYLRDLQTGTTTAVASSLVGGLEFTSDSSHLLFTSGDTTLTSNPIASSTQNLFERNLSTGANVLVSVDSTGTGVGIANAPQTNGGAYSASSDGRYVAFLSSASTFVKNDSNNSADAFVRDTVASTTTLVSVDQSGTTSASGDSSVTTPVISPDGRYVAFGSSAQNVVAGLTFTTPNPSSGGAVLYLRDLSGKTTSAISVRADDSVPGYNNDNDPFDAVFSADSSSLAFVDAPGFDTNGLLPSVHYNISGGSDVYEYNLTQKALQLVSLNSDGTAAGNQTSGAILNDSTVFVANTPTLAVSANGQFVYFNSSASNLVASLTTTAVNVYRRDTVNHTTILVSADPTGSKSGNADSFGPVVSADGQFVAFGSYASNLVSGDGNGAEDVFLRDTTQNSTGLISQRTSQLPATITAGGSLAGISADGTKVLFTSSSTGLYEPGLPDGDSPFVLVHNTQTGTNTSADLTPDGSQAAGESNSSYQNNATISADGNWVVFTSYAPLDANHPNNGTYNSYQVFEHNNQTGVTTLVSLGADGNPSNQNPVNLAVSNDGRYVAFVSPATNLIAGYVDNGPNAGQNEDYNVYLWDRVSSTLSLVSHLPGSTSAGGNNISFGPVFSPDGTKLAFVSSATNLVSGITYTPKAANLFVYDVATKSISLASRAVGTAATGNGSSGSAAYDTSNDPFLAVVLDNPNYAFSANNQYLFFDSLATNLLSGITFTSSPHTNIFRRDLVNNVTTLISVNAAGTGSDDGPYQGGEFAISSDGTRVAFTSSADNLVAGFAGNVPYSEVYLRNLVTNTTTLVSAIPGSTTQPGTESSGFSQDAENPAISPDGRYVAFTSDATNLDSRFTGVANPNGASALYLRDTTTGKTILVTSDQSGTGFAAVGALPARFATNGTLFFDSVSDDLVAGDRNLIDDIFSFAPVGTATIRGEVFSDTNSNGQLDSGDAGIPYSLVFIDTNHNGQLDSGEPNVVTDSQGKYAFNNLAPGAYTVRVVPQAQYSQTNGSSLVATITTDGQIVSGVNFGAKSLSGPDLVVSGVTVDPTGAAGQSVNVSWTVTNQGVNAATGSWVNAVYLSPTPTVSPNAQLVGLFPESGPLSPSGGATTIHQSIVVPGLVPANYYVVIVADYRNQLGDTDRSNNTAPSAAPIGINVASLTVGTPASGQVHAQSDTYYQVVVPAGKSLVVTLTGAPSGADNELYVSRGSVPTPSTFDAADFTDVKGNRTVTVPATQAGTYFILVHNRAGGSGALPFTIEATTPALALQSIGLSSGGNTGSVTIPILGAGLNALTTASLSGTGLPTIPASSTVLGSDGATLYATFNLSGQPAGQYNVNIANGSAISSLAQAFHIVAGTTGDPIQFSFSVPAYNRDLLPSLAYVTVTNTGNTDVPAPLLELTADQASFKLVDEPENLGNTIDFLALSSTGPAGVLAPGETTVIAIPFVSTTSVRHYNIQFSLSEIDGSQAFDWSKIPPLLSSADAAVPNFAAAFAYLQQEVGNTWGAYIAMLDRNASLIPPEVGNADNIGALLSQEFDKAVAATGTSLSGVLQTGSPGVSNAGRTVYAVDTTSGVQFAATTLNDGSFVFRTLPAGTYNLSVDGLRASTPAPVTVAAGHAVAGVTLTTTASATITGSTLSQTGSAFIAAATITATNETDGTEYEVTSDSLGQFDFTGLEPGIYDLVADAAGFARTLVSSVDVTSSDASKNVVMAAQSTIQATVGLAPGGPVASSLTVTADATGNTDPSQVYATSSSTLGFILSGLPAGTFDLMVGMAGYISQTVHAVTVGAGGTVNLGAISLSPAGTITGTLTSDDPAVPAGEALVVALQGSTLVSVTKADDSGNFTLQNLTAGSYTFEILGSSDVVLAPAVTLTAGQSLSGVALTVAPGGTISGILTNSQNGQALPGVPVDLLLPDGSEQATQTAADGSYSFTGLALGSYHVYVSLNTAGSSKNVTVSSLTGTAVAANLQLAGVAEVSGVLKTGSGTPIADGTVTLLQNGNAVASADTDATGAYSLLLVNTGTFDVVATAPEGTFVPVLGVAVTAGSNVVENFNAGTGSLHVTLTNGAATLTGTTVELLLTAGGYNSVATTATVDASGIATFANLAPGTYTLIAQSADDAYVALTSNTLTAGQTSNVAMNMTQAGVVSGVVTGTGGVPLANASVTVQISSPFAIAFGATTDANGHYSIAGLPAGTYDLVALADTYQAQIHSSLSVSGATALNITLAASTTQITGRVVDSSNNPILGSFVQVLDASGHIVGSATVDSSGNFKVTSAVGTNLTLIVNAPGSAAPTIAPFSAVSGATVALGSIVLQPLAIDPVAGQPPAQANSGGQSASLVDPVSFFLTVQQTLNNLKQQIQPDNTPIPPPDCPDAEGAYEAAVAAQKALNAKVSAIRSEIDGALLEAANADIQAAADIFKIVGIALDVVAAVVILKNGVGFALNVTSRVSSAVRPPSFLPAESAAAALLKSIAIQIPGVVLSAKSVSDAANSLKAANSSGEVFGANQTTTNAVASTSKAIASLLGLAATFAAPPALQPYFALVSNLVNVVGETGARLYQDAFDDIVAIAKKLDNELGKLTQDVKQYYSLYANFRQALINYNKALSQSQDCLTPPVPVPPKKQPPKRNQSQHLVNGDPNNLSGPAGFGPQQYISQANTFGYNLEFANDAPGVEIPVDNATVTLQLDSHFDWSTFQLGAIGFGSTLINVPAGRQSFSTTVNTTNPDGSPLEVEVSASLNLQTGLVTWTFSSIDPATGMLPSSVFDGFLPVNDASDAGVGYVNFTVDPKPGLADGTTLNEQGSVIFDVNAPVVTNTYTNTIDDHAPTSSVNPLPATEPTSFTVSWGGSDAAGGSGIGRYNVYVSDNGGPFTLWQPNTPLTSAVYTGVNGHSYEFYSVATDNLGFVQTTPAGAQAKTTVVATVSPTPTPTPTPPVTVQSVQVETVNVRVGKKTKKEKVLVLGLSGDVNSGQAQSLGAYQLLLGKTKKKVTTYTKPVALASASYNASTHTVTLVPKKALSLTLPQELKVTAALIDDLTGRPIDGNGDGKSGGDFLATITKGRASITPMAAAAVDAALHQGIQPARRRP